MPKRLDLDTVLRKINERCNEKNYDFLGFCDKEGNECEWYGNKTYLKLHCNKCGNNWGSTRYSDFIHKHTSCPKCVGMTYTIEEKIEKIKNKCKEKNYDFLGFCDKDGNDCKWHGKETYIKIHCNKCNNTWNTTYNNFINKDHNCRKCLGYYYTKEEVIPIIENKCKEKNYAFLGFCDKDGNDCEWYGKETHLKLHCNKCGNNWFTTDYSHFIKRSQGCSKCIGKSLAEEERINIVENKCKDRNYEFLGFCDKDGNNIHFTDVKHTYLKLYCKNCKNMWTTTIYDNFISKNEGCSSCNISHLEYDAEHFLGESNIIYEKQKRFDWLGKQSLDFYLPQYNIAIECQGIQHFKEVKFGSINQDEAEALFQKTLERDSRKRRLCEENGVKLLYYSNLGIEYPYEVFEDKDKLLEEIKKI